MGICGHPYPPAIARPTPIGRDTSLIDETDETENKIISIPYIKQTSIYAYIGSGRKIRLLWCTWTGRRIGSCSFGASLCVSFIAIKP